MDEEREMKPEELVGLAAVLNVLVVGSEHDLKVNGHMQMDPRQTPAYARMIKELVRRGVLPSDDLFAPKSSTEDRLAGEGIGGVSPIKLA